MALTIKNVEKTCKGKLTIYMEKGIKTTDAIWCSRFEIKDYVHSILKINGEKAKLKFATWNGHVIN